MLKAHKTKNAESSVKKECHSALSAATNTYTDRNDDKHIVVQVQTTRMTLIITITQLYHKILLHTLSLIP